MRSSSSFLVDEFLIIDKKQIVLFRKTKITRTEKRSLVYVFRKNIISEKYTCTLYTKLVILLPYT